MMSSHGTGHGIGSFLNVHEGPQGIGMHILYHDTPLKEGMVISNGASYCGDAPPSSLPPC